MINVIGIIVIALGFFVLPISGGVISPIIFFWLGFLFLLSQSNFIPAEAKWNRYARGGMLVNVLIFFIGALYFAFFYRPASLPTGGNVFTSDWFIWLFSPASELLPAAPSQMMPDGTVIARISFFRVAVISFFDVIIYLILGVAVGNFLRLLKREKVS
jgi:hypothetical protein